MRNLALLTGRVSLYYPGPDQQCPYKYQYIKITTNILALTPNLQLLISGSQTQISIDLSEMDFLVRAYGPNTLSLTVLFVEHLVFTIWFLAICILFNCFVI